MCRATELDTNLGETCCLAGRVEEALMHGRRAIALDPLYVGALSNVCIALFEQKRFEEIARASSWWRTANAATRCAP